MRTLALPLETKNALVHQYHKDIYKLQQYLLIIKGEKSRCKYVLSRSKDPDIHKKFQKRLEMLEYLQWELEDAIQYARACRRRGFLVEAVSFLDRKIKTLEVI